MECINFLTGNPISTDIYDDNAYWYPDLSQLAESIRDDLKDQFKESIALQFQNRQQRRILTRRILPGGKLSKEALRFLQKSRPGLLNELQSQFPFSDRFFKDDLMLRFAAGDVDGAELVDEMSVVFRDVETFIAWTYGTRDKEKKLITWLRRDGDKLVSAIENIRVDLTRLINLAGPTFDIKTRLDKLLSAKALELRSQRLNQIISEVKQVSIGDRQKQKILKSQFGELPSTDAYVAAVCEYFKRNAGMNRTPKASDSGDLFHLAYMPYCDLFRADSETSEMAKRLAAPFKTIMVPKLRNLPSTIEQELSRPR